MVEQLTLRYFLWFFKRKDTSRNICQYTHTRKAQTPHEILTKYFALNFISFGTIKYFRTCNHYLDSIYLNGILLLLLLFSLRWRNLSCCLSTIVHIFMVLAKLTLKPTLAKWKCVWTSKNGLIYLVHSCIQILRGK